MPPASSLRRRLAWGVTVLLLAAVAAVGYWKAQQWLHPEDARRLPAVAGCDLEHTPCEGRLPGGWRLRVSLAPRPVPLMQPLELEVTLLGGEGPEPLPRRVDFRGVEMEMGLNRAPLQRSEAPSPDGATPYRGAITLPACVSRQMTWEVVVRLQGTEGPLTLPFRLTTRRGSPGPS